MNEVIRLPLALLSLTLYAGLLTPHPGQTPTARAATVPRAAAPGISSPSAQQPQQASPKVIRYAQRLMAQYDRDQSGDLTATEWAAMRGRPETLDSNHDGKVSLAEVVSHIIAYSQNRRLGKRSGIMEPHPTEIPPFAQRSATAQERQNAGENGIAETGRGVQTAKPYYVPARLLPSGLPEWFAERDQNGDGQLSIVEYAPTRGRTTVATFHRLDADRDGLLTPAECAKPSQPAASEK